MENLCNLRFHYAILLDLRISPLILYKVEYRARRTTGVRQGLLILQLYFLGIHQAVGSWRSGALMFSSAAAPATVPTPAPVDLATVTSWLSHQREVAQRLGDCP